MSGMENSNFDSSRFLGDAARYAAVAANWMFFTLSLPAYMVVYVTSMLLKRPSWPGIVFRRNIVLAMVTPALCLAYAIIYGDDPGIYNPYGMLVVKGLIAAGLIWFVFRIVTSKDGVGEKAAAHQNSKASADVAEPSPPIRVPDNLEELLSRKIRGQDLALQELSAAVLTSARHYAVQGKPLGMYLLVGATGSGKTETAKQLAAILDWPIHREECNQYATQYSITRLIGSARGYVDSEMGGSLTNALMDSEHGILLLDEIEKAHPSVARTLMTLADEGTITTGMGDVVDARGWMILATSNAAQAEIIKAIEKPDVPSYARIASIKKLLADHWPAEIIARMRSVVPYKPVSDDAMLQVFRDMLFTAATEAGATPKHTLHIDESAIALLSTAYRSLRQYGVREMRGFVDRQLALPMMRMVDGGQLHLMIRAEGDRLLVEPNPHHRMEPAKAGGKPRGAKGWLERLGLAKLDR